MNILFVGAHHDDLEVSIGGSVARWVSEGHKVFSAILTSSTWVSPDGTQHRNVDQVEAYTKQASKILGYTNISLNVCPCLELTCTDDNVVRVLRLVSEYDIDMLVTIHPNDAHPDHRVASEIAINASRKIPRVLMSRVSWNSYPGGFNPNFFVDISAHLGKKYNAIKCFEDEYARIGQHWETFIRSSSELYGLEAGCSHAEGFEVLKYLY